MGAKISGVQGADDLSSDAEKDEKEEEADGKATDSSNPSIEGMKTMDELKDIANFEEENFKTMLFRAVKMLEEANIGRKKISKIWEGILLEKQKRKKKRRTKRKSDNRMNTSKNRKQKNKRGKKVLRVEREEEG